MEIQLLSKDETVRVGFYLANQDLVFLPRSQSYFLSFFDLRSPHPLIDVRWYSSIILYQHEL